MPARVVMVEFHSGVTAQDVADFECSLRELAAQTSNLVRMTCGEHYPASDEAGLSANAPNVVFGHFVSVWEFADDEALTAFVCQPAHRALAAEKFRRVVKRRYVANIR